MKITMVPILEISRAPSRNVFCEGLVDGQDVTLELRDHGSEYHDDSAEGYVDDLVGELLPPGIALPFDIHAGVDEGYDDRTDEHRDENRAELVEIDLDHLRCSFLLECAVLYGTITGEIISFLRF